MKKLTEEFSLDFRIMRVVTASSDPVKTMQDINAGKISVRTLFDTLEIMDAQATIEEVERKKAEREAKARMANNKR